MTGIIFGIAAVVTVVALGEGAKQRTLDNIKELGTNVVSIYPGRDFFDDRFNTVYAKMIAPNAIDRGGSGFTQKANVVGSVNFGADAVNKPLLC